MSWLVVRKWCSSLIFISWLFDTVNIGLSLGIKKWEQKSQEVENLLAFDFLYVVNVSASRVLPLEVQAVFTEDLVEFF